MVKLKRWSQLCPVSQIRRLRITFDKNNYQGPYELSRYVNSVEGNYNLHHQFWYCNNQRFAQELSAFRQMNPKQDESGFYRDYMLKYKSEFHEYHKQSWKGSFTMIGEEYKWILAQLKHTMTNFYLSMLRRLALT